MNLLTNIGLLKKLLSISQSANSEHAKINPNPTLQTWFHQKFLHCLKCRIKFIVPVIPGHGCWKYLIWVGQVAPTFQNHLFWPLSTFTISKSQHICHSTWRYFQSAENVHQSTKNDIFLVICFVIFFLLENPKTPVISSRPLLECSEAIISPNTILSFAKWARAGMVKHETNETWRFTPNPDKSDMSNYISTYSAQHFPEPRKLQWIHQTITELYFRS